MLFHSLKLLSPCMHSDSRFLFLVPLPSLLLLSIEISFMHSFWIEKASTGIKKNTKTDSTVGQTTDVILSEIMIQDEPSGEKFTASFCHIYLMLYISGSTYHYFSLSKIGDVLRRYFIHSIILNFES